MASGLEHPGNCPRAATSTSTSISEADAKTLTDRFNGIRDHSGSDLGDWRKTAERIFADEFRVHSNSYLALKGRSVCFSHLRYSMAAQLICSSWTTVLDLLQSRVRLI